MIERGGVTMPKIVKMEDRIGSEVYSFPVTSSIGLNPLEENNTSAIKALLASSEASMEIINQRRDSLYIVVPITIIYVLIFFTGLVGNVSTCVVIARNRSMHTATNYYLFSLAVSDLLLLISGLPPEMYYIWYHFPYVFGEMFCVVQSFAAETSANATVLTITAFTVERYVAICHPFISHTMSKLSRAVKYIILIWLLALCLAIPQAIQFGVILLHDRDGTVVPETDTCSRKWLIIQHAFEISTILFFVAPMTIITVLYVLIGIKLRRSRLLTGARRRNPIANGINHSDCARGRSASQRNVIRMLVAVVAAFFICWAPFHAQRLLAVYAAQSSEEESQATISHIYVILTYVSGVFYYLSTTVNPLLYNIMSNKFREAFKTMLAEHCGGRIRGRQAKDPRRQTYSSLSRYGRITLKRANERNSGSLSASEENQRLPPSSLIRSQLHRPLPNNTNESSPVVNDPSSQPMTARSSSIADEPPSDPQRAIRKSGKILANPRSDLSSVEPNSQPFSTTTTTTPSLQRGDCKSLNFNGVALPISYSFTKNQRPPLKTVTLGLIAERLRFGTKSLFASQHQRAIGQENEGINEQPKHQRGGGGGRRNAGGKRWEAAGVKAENHGKLQSNPSIESSKTISNSSLQDLGETEFTGSELATYMGEVNIDLVTHRPIAKS